jgi:hypothetical protein
MKFILDEYLKDREEASLPIISGTTTMTGSQRGIPSDHPEAMELHRHFINRGGSGIEYLILEVSARP